MKRNITKTFTTGFLIAFICLPTIIYGENQKTIVRVVLTQPDSLKVTVDTASIVGNQIYLGTTLKVSGGTPDYANLWTPSTNLDNPAIANPIANSGAIPEYTILVTDKNNCTSCAILSLLKTGLVITNAGSNDISLYPVPAIDKMYLKLPVIEGDAEISVINSAGKILQKKTLHAQDIQTIQTISFSGYTPGNYLVQVKNKLFTKTKLVIIK